MKHIYQNDDEIFVVANSADQAKRFHARSSKDDPKTISPFRKMDDATVIGMRLKRPGERGAHRKNLTAGEFAAQQSVAGYIEGD